MQKYVQTLVTSQAFKFVAIRMSDFIAIFHVFVHKCEIYCSPYEYICIYVHPTKIHIIQQNEEMLNMYCKLERRPKLKIYYIHTHMCTVIHIFKTSGHINKTIFDRKRSSDIILHIRTVNKYSFNNQWDAPIAQASFRKWSEKRWSPRLVLYTVFFVISNERDFVQCK